MGKEGEAEVGSIKVRKNFPHRHGARKPMGDPTIERVNPMFTQLNLWCKPDANKKVEPKLRGVFWKMICWH